MRAAGGTSSEVFTAVLLSLALLWARYLIERPVWTLSFVVETADCCCLLKNDFSTGQTNAENKRTPTECVCVCVSECPSEFPMGPDASAGTAGGRAEDRHWRGLLWWSSRRHRRQPAQFWYFHSFKPFLWSQLSRVCSQVKWGFLSSFQPYTVSTAHGKTELRSSRTTLLHIRQDYIKGTCALRSKHK